MGTSKMYIEKREEREERKERKERGEDTDYDEGRERRSAVVLLCVIFFVLVLGIPLMSS